MANYTSKDMFVPLCPRLSKHTKMRAQLCPFRTLFAFQEGAFAFYSISILRSLCRYQAEERGGKRE
jgi:hypothetical protein